MTSARKIEPQRPAMLLLAAVGLSFFAGCSKPTSDSDPGLVASATSLPDEKPVYSVKVYDAERDPEADLAATIRLVSEQPTPRNILLLIGGNNCIWCHRLERYLLDHPDMVALLRENYVIMKVDAIAKNAKFIERYEDIGGGIPTLRVLDGGGKLLHAQSTAVLEEGDSYNEQAVREFLNRWTPEAVDAAAADAA